MKSKNLIFLPVALIVVLSVGAIMYNLARPDEDPEVLRANTPPPILAPPSTVGPVIAPTVKTAPAYTIVSIVVGPNVWTTKWESQRGGQTDAMACHVLCLLPGSSSQPVACSMNCYSKWPSAQSCFRHPLQAASTPGAPSCRDSVFLNAHPQFRQRPHDLHGFQTHADHLADQAHDVLGVVGAVGVVDDAAALVGLDAVLVDDPVERGAVAEAVVEGGGEGCRPG